MNNSSHALTDLADWSALVLQALRSISVRYSVELGLPSFGPDDLLLLMGLSGGSPSRQELYQRTAFAVSDFDATYTRAEENGLLEVAPDGSLRATTLAAMLYGRLMPISQHCNQQWREQLDEAPPDEASLAVLLALLQQETIDE